MLLQELKPFIDASPDLTWWRVWVFDPFLNKYGSMNVFKATTYYNGVYHIDLHIPGTGLKGWTPVWEGSLDNGLSTFNIYDDQDLRKWISRLMITNREVSSINHAPNHYASAIRQRLTWCFHEKARQQQETNS